MEIELWQIGESAAAPKFNIISKPNDWTRSVGQSARRIGDEALTATRLKKREYWTSYLQRSGTTSSKKPQPHHWMDFSIGRSDFRLRATTHSREHRLGVELNINGERVKDYYGLLYEARDDIEAELGEALDWKELPDKKTSRIVCYKLDSDDWQQDDGQEEE